MSRKVLVPTALIFAAAACGGGSKTIPKADYVKRGDAICAKYQAKIDAEKTPEADADIKAYIHRGVQLTLQEVSDLRGLPKSDRDADKFSKLYDDVEKTFKELDKKSVAEIKNIPESFGQSVRDGARALGFTKCGQS